MGILRERRIFGYVFELRLKTIGMTNALVLTTRRHGSNRPRSTGEVGWWEMSMKMVVVVVRMMMMMTRRMTRMKGENYNEVDDKGLLGGMRVFDESDEEGSRMGWNVVRKRNGLLDGEMRDKKAAVDVVCETVVDGEAWY